jgi:hypothetical protein
MTVCIGLQRHSEIGADHYGGATRKEDERERLP